MAKYLHDSWLDTVQLGGRQQIVYREVFHQGIVVVHGCQGLLQTLNKNHISFSLLLTLSQHLYFNINTVEPFISDFGIYDSSGTDLLNHDYFPYAIIS